MNTLNNRAHGRIRRLGGIWIASALALLVGLGVMTGTAAAAAPCGCRETGEYNRPAIKLPAAQEVSPGGGTYRLRTTDTASSVILRVEKAAGGALVKEFELNRNRVVFGFSPDGNRFMVSHGMPNAQIDEITLYDLAADEQVYFTTATAGASVAFSPHGRWFLLNVLNGPGQAEIIVVDSVSGDTALYAPIAFETIPGDPGDRFGVIGGGFSSDAEDRSYVYAYRAAGGHGIQLSLRNLASRSTVLSRPVAGAWWKFSKCGDTLGLVNQTSGASVSVRIYKTAAPGTVGTEKTFAPIPADLRLESTLEQHRVVTTDAAGRETVTNVGPNEAAANCPPVLAIDRLTVDPASAVGGERNASATIQLTAPTTSSLVVTLSSSDTGAATVPSTVTVLSGAQSKTFTVTTKQVPADRTVTISATAAGVTKTAALTVKAPAVTGPAIDSLSIDGLRPMGGTNVTGTITLTGPAGAASAAVALQSSVPSMANVPATATVAAGQTAATFTVSTSVVVADAPAVITASAGGFSRSVRLMVLTPDRDCERGSSDPVTETLKARSFGAFDDAGDNVDCVTNVTFENGITVGPGTTGLAAGTPVQLVVNLRLDGSLHTSPPVGSGGTTAEGTGQYRIIDESVPDDGEGAPTAVDFDARFNLQQYKADPNGLNVYWDARHRLDTNATDGQSIVDYDESASADAVGATKDTGVMTAAYSTTVGAHLSISGRVSTVASAYGSGASAVADFSNTFKAGTEPGPGYEGLELVYDEGGEEEPVNRPPTCTAGDVSTAEGTPLTGSVSCTDADGDALTYAVGDGPAHGTLSAIGAGGTFTYTPAAGFSGNDSFTFKANDGLALSEVATVTVTVSPVNGLPVCTDGTGSTDQGVPLGAGLTCTDPDGDPLTYSVATGPASGTLSAIAADGSFTYTPTAGFSGTDSFTFQADDGSGTGVAATFTVTVKKVEVQVPPPSNKDLCKNGGWQKYTNPTFKNQGDCVSWVNTH